MSDDPQTTAHPFDALASYVDGSADTAERVAAEAHLQTCDRCRRDVALASTGRSALRVLPQVEAPGLAAAVAATVGIDGGSTADGQPVAAVGPAAESDRSQRRGRRWQAVWGAGVAAAAVLAAVLIYMGVVSGGNSGGQAAAPPTGAPSDAAGNAGVTLDTKAVDRIATSLAGGRSAAPAPAAPSVTGGVERNFSSAEAATAETCVRTAGAVDPNATLAELLPVTFQGTPAYVGAFESGSQVQVIVSSRDGCQPLYVATARKG